MTRLTLGQVFHGLFYAPNYIARGLGYFHQEELEVAARYADPPSSIIAMLLSGDADVVLAGPARLHQGNDQNATERLVCIGQATAGNFFFLISRDAKERFTLSHLLGKRLLLFPGTPTPWLCLQHLMRAHRLDPLMVQTLRPASPELSLHSYLSGDADFIELPEPYVERLIDYVGEQQIVAMGPLLGRVPFSVYLAKRDHVRREPEHFARFVRAIARAQRHLREHSAEEIAAALTQFFPELPMPILVRAVNRYQQQDLWGRNPRVGKVEFDRLYTILTGIEEAPPQLYRQMVDVGAAPMNA
jgi:NitT/TauT family transport system substrate-binding protein